MNLIAVIPAHNEQLNIKQVIEGVKKYTSQIVVVDDGSKDKTFEIAVQSGVKVYRHESNKGLGAALKTGIGTALAEGADIIITLDGDGQHDPGEIPSVVKPILENKADFVIGSRFLRYQRMPALRRMGNYFLNLITFLFFGALVSDSQSGMRAFSRRAAEKIQITSNDMEVSSEIVAEIKRNNFKIKEIPIKAIYTPYSLSKGQGFVPGIKTIMNIFKLRFDKK